MLALDRILVTGASGFVGRLLVSALSTKYPKALVLAAGGTTTPPLEAHSNNISVTQCDLLISDHCKRLAQFQPDIVFHLAGNSSVGQALSAHVDGYTPNLMGTINLSNALVEFAPNASMVFASSGEVYGRAFLNGPATESTVPEPASSYAKSKLAGEWAIEAAFAGRSSATILRLFNHTGPGQDQRFVAPDFAAQVAKIECGLADGPLMVGNLSAERDFLDVKDVIAAYLVLPDLIQKRGNPTFDIFNICSGSPRTIQSVLMTLLKASNIQIDVEQDPSRLRPSEIPTATGNPNRFTETTGWRPAYDFEQTLCQILDYWKTKY